jgi:hypothetical protein
LATATSVAIWAIRWTLVSRILRVRRAPGKSRARNER